MRGERREKGKSGQGGDAEQRVKEDDKMIRKPRVTAYNMENNWITN